MTDSFQFDFDPAARIQARIDDVLVGRGVRWQLEAIQREVLKAIRRHVGADKAVQIAEVQRELAPRTVDEREIKATVKSLVEDFEIPIGSSRQAPYGYYIAVTAEDIEQSTRPVINQIRSEVRRLRAFAGPQRVREVFGQLQMENEKDGAA